MNQKYNDYDPGTYDTSKIFLQADPTTGALEKVNLPAPGEANKFTRLASFPSSANATTTSLTTLYTYTIPASTLAAAGDTVKIKLTGTAFQDDGYSQLRITIPGTVDDTFCNIPGTNIILEIQLIRISGAGGSLLFTKYDTENGYIVVINESYSIDLTDDIEILVEGLVETTGSMRAQSMTINLELV
jgi:hypothetical protein